jgi:hypothetical protein
MGDTMADAGLLAVAPVSEQAVWIGPARRHAASVPVAGFGS